MKTENSTSLFFGPYCKQSFLYEDKHNEIVIDILYSTKVVSRRIQMDVKKTSSLCSVCIVYFVSTIGNRAITSLSRILNDALRNSPDSL